MNSDEVLTPQQLDARVALHTLKERTNLLRTAKGRMTWRIAVGLLMALVLIGIGLIQLYQGGRLPKLSHENIGFGFLFVGVINMALAIWAAQQSRLDAILEIVRSQESTRS